MGISDSQEVRSEVLQLLQLLLVHGAVLPQQLQLCVHLINALRIALLNHQQLKHQTRFIQMHVCGNL